MYPLANSGFCVIIYYVGVLPTAFEEIEIDGGCHAYFGMYGEQDGDGRPTLCDEKQISVSTEHIYEFMKESTGTDPS